jgi:hypothetical protein
MGAVFGLWTLERRRTDHVLLNNVMFAGVLRQVYEVGVEHARSVAEKSGENESLCVCTVRFLGHTVRVRLRVL